MLLVFQSGVSFLILRIFDSYGGFSKISLNALLKKKIKVYRFLETLLILFATIETQHLVCIILGTDIFLSL